MAERGAERAGGRGDGQGRPARRDLAVALAAYTLLLAVVLLAPSSTEQSSAVEHVRQLALDLGVSPVRLTQSRAEFLCNIAILAPVSALGSLLWPRTRWLDWLGWSFLAATAVELVQGLLLPGRTPSTADVVANTLGGLAGAAAVAMSRRLRR